eukprot:TRINITY_DN31279_c0_g1_i1.p1 TRINITY_DN31279_c0_g1~~TRINITY_DN31279_c0_g1_i1.p1  ORF type:complete len:1107 (+),score=226.73 TRINITY_DN31279_c0_g1_i1:71-3391(+)
MKMARPVAAVTRILGLIPAPIRAVRMTHSRQWGAGGSALKEVTNLTSRSHDAAKSLSEHQQEYFEALGKEQARTGAVRHAEHQKTINARQIADSERLAEEAAANPRADMAPRVRLRGLKDLQAGEVIRLRYGSWHALPRHVRNMWHVHHGSGLIQINNPDLGTALVKLGPFFCQLPYAALEMTAAPLFRVGDSVNVHSEAFAALPHLRFLAQGMATVTGVNSSNGKSYVRFQNGNHEWIPDRFLQESSPTAPALDEADNQELLKGFRKRDFVRDCTGKHLFQRGVVDGICPSNEANLMVRVPNCYGYDGGDKVSIPAEDLCSEETWHRRRVEELKLKIPGLEETIVKANAAVDQAAVVRQALGQQTDAKQKAANKASSALKRASKGAREVSIVTVVTFRKGKAAPAAWRDISKHVDHEWAVAVPKSPLQDGSEPRPVLLTLVDCKLLARSVTQSKECGAGPHIITAKGQLLRELAEGPRKPVSLSVGSSVAKSILKKLKSKAEPPAQLHSFSLLKAALGALEGVVLDSRVQEFFDSPETGIIRAKELAAPSAVSDVLRPYQLTGYQWLVNNARNGLGCILADDMGLGKTIQAISLILYMKQHDMLQRPILVVVPKGLLSSWQRELKRWAGDKLKLHVYFGQQRQLLANASPDAIEKHAENADVTASAPKRRRLSRKQAAPDVAPPVVAVAAPQKRKGRHAVSGCDEADVFLTSYGTFRIDAEKLASGQVFGGMILDEAQQIKNYSSLIAKAVKRMAEATGSIRVALSGTPVENRLADLHSQFEFILPGYLAASRADFERDFGKPLAAAVKRRGQVDPIAVEKQRLLQRIVQPFILRRLKTDPAIAADLPPKVEQTHDCDLSEIQAKLYRAVQEATLQRAAQAEGFGRHGLVLAMLHALREVCNHPTCLAEKRRPDQFPTDNFPLPGSIEASGKCAKLHEILDAALQSGEKVLIFSSYLGTIDVLAQQIEERFNDKVLKIVGSMDKDQREAAVDSFQTDPNCSVLLLSLQAGGVGLTLTAATHVVHFDRCYNPAKENQATDRAHRIGQKKTVFVHRLVTKDTFEERLGEIMEQKQQLSDLTVQSGEGWIADLNNEELRDLFSLKSRS